MTFSPQIFLSNAIQNGGFAQSNRFRVIMNIPPGVSKFIGKSTFNTMLDSFGNVGAGLSNILGGGSGTDPMKNNSAISRYLSLQCENTELPGRAVQTNEVDVYGPVYKRPYKTSYTDHAFTFICNNEFMEKKLFDTWMEAMVPTDTHNVRYAINQNGERNYQTDVAIVQYDDTIKQIYAVKLIDAFPISVGAMGLNWSDDGFHRLSVQFAYTKYEVVYNLQYELPNLADVFGAVGTRVLGGIL